MPLGNGHVFFRRCDAVPKRVNVFDLLFFRQRFEAFGKVGKWWCGHLSSEVSTKPSLSSHQGNTGRQIVHSSQTGQSGRDHSPSVTRRAQNSVALGLLVVLPSWTHL